MPASGASPPPDEVTADSLLRGRVRLYQPARGARMSLDPVLLAGFVAPPYGRFLDIGAGTGALSFLLLARDEAASGVAVEIQPRLAALAVRGRDENRWGDRLRIMLGDVREPPDGIDAAGFDLVVTNPPFRPVGEGSVSPHPERALAHHEITLALDEWIAAAARAVRPGGRVTAILPASRQDELVAALLARNLNPARLRPVQPYVGRPHLRIMVEARQESGPLVVEPPLVIHESDGTFAVEVARLLG